MNPEVERTNALKNNEMAWFIEKELILKESELEMGMKDFLAKPSEYPSHSFSHKLPAFRVKQMTRIFGSPTITAPTYFTNTRGHLEHSPGQVTWKKPTIKRFLFEKEDNVPQLLFIDELTIHDVIIPHHNPGTHVDFMFTTSETPSPSKRALLEVQELGDSISVNLRFGMGTVTAGCHFLAANIVSHYVAAMMLNGKYINVAEA